MPTLFEYLGIIISFYSHEHDPIHIHADYGNSSVKVSFFIKEGKIYRITYTPIKGKFPEAKMKDLKKFIGEYKYEIIEKWTEFFTWNIKIKTTRITKKL